MRVLTVTNMYPTADTPTYGTFVADEVAALRADPRIAACPVMFVDGRRHPVNYLRAVGRLRRMIRRTSPDVVHAHYGLAGAVAVTQRAIPTVITFHTGDLELARWQRTVSRQAYRRASENICVSRRAMTQLPGPAHHLTCGVDVDLFTPRDRASARTAHGVGDGEIALLFPSSPAVPKKAYPRFAEVRDVLAQRGHKVRELVLRGLRRDEVPELMAAADVMVMTSTQEGAPVAVMEALACGLGVVATPAGDVAEMLEGARNAFCAEFDAVAFADAVERAVAADRDPRAPDPRSGRFASTVIADQLIAILATAARSDPQAGAQLACA